jgi:hypothetical protein
MEAITQAAVVIGGAVMIAGGVAITGLIFYFSAALLGKYAWLTWDHLASIYRLECMKYWFKRMQDNGTHVLRKEHDEKLAAKVVSSPERDSTNLTSGPSVGKNESHAVASPNQQQEEE